MRIINGKMILKDAVVKNASILIKRGKIERIWKGAAARAMDTIDARGLFVSPGFIDTHIHGDPAKIFTYVVKFGTTAIVPTISCCSHEDLMRQVDVIKRFIVSDPLGESVLGLRLEGPFISKGRSGAQDKAFIRPPSVKALREIIKECGGLLKILTIAPEIKGACQLIKILKHSNIIASIGHTSADYRDCFRGMDAGATHATHLFNGMRRVFDDGGGCALACLADDRVSIEIICDLIHVPKELLHLTFTAKSKDKMILITDSVKALDRDEHDEDQIKGGVYRLRDGTIAGSQLTMIDSVRNAVRRLGIDLKDAIRFASLNPARLLGLDAQKGSISKGKDADIVIFDKDFNVKMTIVRGRIVYRKA